MNTPSFKGTHLFDRLCWAKENLDGVQSDYRVVYEDSIDECAKILVPDPNWMACALQGGILPPVWVYWELAKDEAQPDFCLLYTSPSPRDGLLSRMPSSA